MVAGSAATLLLAGCGRASDAGEPTPSPRSAGGSRIRYGNHPDQFAVLRMPARTPRSLVVLLHGGYWSDAYGLDLMDPLATDLTGRDHATWNVEYRRIGDGGGYPATFADVAAAVDRLADLPLPRGLPVTVVGHSAGGHLAAWAASRNVRTPGGPPRVTAAATVTLSGVLCLAAADRESLGGGAVAALMGGHDPGGSSSYDLADPARLAPARGTVRVVHAREDQVVPLSQSTGYVAADTAAGGTARLVTVPGDHFALIDPTSEAWHTTRSLVDEHAAVTPPRP